jgi:hypothetical protein
MPKGTRLEVFTNHKPAGARTNRVVTLRKEADGYADWEIIERPATADHSILRPTFGEADPVVSIRDIADAIMSGDVWAGVHE